MNIQEKEPFTTNQNKTTKPSIPKTATTLNGKFANSMNGGHNRPFFWKRVMAGEKHETMTMQAFIRLLTPKTPVYQKLKCCVRTFFVPDSAVWKNSEAFIAQKKNLTDYTPNEIPNTGGQIIPYEQVYNTLDPSIETGYVNFANTTAWRDSFVSTYIPRPTLTDILINNTTDGANYALPKYNVLALRGIVKIYNDHLRHKEYESKIPEFDEDTVTSEEWKNYIQSFGINQEGRNVDYYQLRAKKDNSYYSNYHTTLQGFEEEMPENNEENLLSQFIKWENKFAEMRSQAENAQKNDWEIIAEIRGSKLLTEGKIQMIGKKTFNLNYSAITQSTYNTNEDIEEQFQIMGTQGAYSYTEIVIPLYNHMEFNEEGTIHAIMTVTADAIYEKGFDRTMLNVNALDIYRPDLKNEKEDVLYDIELGELKGNSQANIEKIIGFKRKWSEYYKMPNIISGDMTSEGYYETGWITPKTLSTKVLSNKSFQFFESDPHVYQYYTNINDNKWTAKKKIWKDYTDLNLNENQAIQNQIRKLSSGSQDDIYITGQNQIFFMGEMNCKAILPIEDDIKDNYTQWGEI